MNKAILIGRLTRDPELRHTPNGAATCTFTVAIDRMPDQNGQRQADFINVVTWNRQAENVAKYMTKGRLVAVEGRIQTRNYENNEGRRVYVTEVVAQSVQFLESKNSIPNTQSYSEPNNVPETNFNEQPMETMEVEKDPFASFGESIEISDNDLPF